MNAYDLLRKFLKETEEAWMQAKKDGDYWKAKGLQTLYNLLKEIKDRF